MVETSTHVKIAKSIPQAVTKYEYDYYYRFVLSRPVSRVSLLLGQVPERKPWSFVGAGLIF